MEPHALIPLCRSDKHPYIMALRLLLRMHLQWRCWSQHHCKKRCADWSNHQPSTISSMACTYVCVLSAHNSAKHRNGFLHDYCWQPNVTCTSILLCNGVSTLCMLLLAMPALPAASWFRNQEPIMHNTPSASTEALQTCLMTTACAGATGQATTAARSPLQLCSLVLGDV